MAFVFNLLFRKFLRWGFTEYLLLLPTRFYTCCIQKYTSVNTSSFFACVPEMWPYVQDYRRQKNQRNDLCNAREHHKYCLDDLRLCDLSSLIWNRFYDKVSMKVIYYIPHNIMKMCQLNGQITTGTFSEIIHHVLRGSGIFDVLCSRCLKICDPDS